MKNLVPTEEMDKYNTDTFSAQMRELNKKNPERALDFLRSFKEAFDEALDSDVDDHQEVALLQAKKCLANIKEDKYIKLAQAIISANKSPYEVGLALANIIKILVDKLPHDKNIALANMKGKISKIDPNNISLSALPETAAYGQSITLIKTLLNGYSPEYIKQVLSSIIRSL